MVAQLKAISLGKVYAKRRVIRDISIEVNTGEVVGLLGPNGAGKTTTFYMMMGLIKPNYGSILYNNIDITYYPIHRRARLGIGYLPQEPSVFRGLNVEENIKAVLEINQLDLEKRGIMLEELLAEFSITHLRKVSVLALSGGERRRVEIARCLAVNPKFILLDEPLAGIDPIAISEIRFLIKQLKARNIGIVITDHNVREALSVIDRGYIIHNGTVLMHGNVKEIVEHREVRRIYLGEEFNY